MKKLKNFFREIKNWFKAQIRCAIYKKVIKQQEKQIEELNNKLELLQRKNEDLQFQLDRDDKQQRINELERRQEEYFVQRRALRDEIKELKAKNNNERNY